MKLAQVLQPDHPISLSLYAQENNFRHIALLGECEFANLTHKINECLSEAIEKGCVEFAINEVRQDYDVGEDKTNWLVTIIGFIPK